MSRPCINTAIGWGVLFTIFKSDRLVLKTYLFSFVLVIALKKNPSSGLYVRGGMGRVGPKTRLPAVPVQSCRCVCVSGDAGRLSLGLATPRRGRDRGQGPARQHRPSKLCRDRAPTGSQGDTEGSLFTRLWGRSYLFSPRPRNKGELGASSPTPPCARKKSARWARGGNGSAAGAGRKRKKNEKKGKRLEPEALAT